MGDPAELGNPYGAVGYNEWNGRDPEGLAGYFFDGTGNDSSQPTLGKMTNIALLRKAYLGEKVYSPGVGTYGDKNSGGATGNRGRIILENAYTKLSENYKKGDREIDIFGFSRGAALAREFANMINRRGDPVSWRTAYVGEGPSLNASALGNSPTIRFLGLFDTVGSFGIPGNDDNIGYDLSIPKNVMFVRHAVAAHERRNNFPLSSIMTYSGFMLNQYNQNGRMVERVFRGAHADIGGGYDENGLSLDPLLWMYHSGIAAGVQFGPLDTSSIDTSNMGVHDSNILFWNIRSHPILSAKNEQAILRTSRTVYLMPESK